MKQLINIIAFVSIFVYFSISARTITVAVIDTGVDKASLHKLCKFGHKAFTYPHDNPLQDAHGHGTHVAGTIEQKAGDLDYCIVSIKWYDNRPGFHDNMQNLIKAIRYAVDINVDFINISGGGSTPNKHEKAIVKEALDKGIRLVLAAGNESSNLSTSCDYFPACYDPRATIVGNLLDPKSVSQTYAPIMKAGWQVLYRVGVIKLRRAPNSNYGKPVNRWEVGTKVISTLPSGRRGTMSGTSQATAVATGKMIKEFFSK